MVSQEKIGETSIKKEKITFILTALCAVIYLLQNIGLKSQLWIYSIIRLILGKIRKYGAISLMLLFICQVPHILFNLSWFCYLVARLSADLVLSIFIISFSLCCSEWRGTELFYRSRLFGLSGVVYAVLGYVLVVDKLHPHSFDLPEGFYNVTGRACISFY